MCVCGKQWGCNREICVFSANIHVHTWYTQTHTHTHTRTYTHIHTQTHTDEHIHTHTHTYSYTLIHTLKVLCGGKYAATGHQQLPSCIPVYVYMNRNIGRKVLGSRHRRGSEKCVYVCVYVCVSVCGIRTRFYDCCSCVCICVCMCV